MGETERCLGRGRWRLGRGLELARCSSLPGWGEVLTHLTGPLLPGDLEGVLPATAGDLEEDEVGRWRDILDEQVFKLHWTNTGLGYLLTHSQLGLNLRQSYVEVLSVEVSCLCRLVKYTDNDFHLNLGFK